MTFACLFIAGALRATIPSDTFTLEWRHSVEKTRWQEQYRVERGGLRVTESRIEGFGAGMEPPPGARLANGTWTWEPDAGVLRELRLTSSPYTEDYVVCWRDTCRTLRELTDSRDVDVVSVVPCAR